MHHIAAQLGMLVVDLENRLTVNEYLRWVEYFHTLNNPESSKPNALDSDENLLQEFEIG